MKSWKEFGKSIAEGTGHIVPGKTLVEITGDSRVFIENHRGIRVYGTEEIILGSTYGQMVICGCDLELACLTEAVACVTGKISSICLWGRES